MVFREVSVIEVREALRAWLAGKSERAVAAQAGVDRKTGKRYVMAAVAAGLSREGGEEQLTDELIGQVVSVVRPVRPDGHGQGWAELEARREQVTAWVSAGVPVVKIGILLGRQGVVVAERTLHRFAAERCGAGGKTVTTPVDDGPPGGEVQIDFGYLGLIPAGIAAGLSVCASESASPQWVISRLWLALRRRLPWRLMKFLEEAYEAGLLRRVGATYQFRHIALQQLLAGRSSSRESGWGEQDR
jgi:hypothetical protein